MWLPGQPWEQTEDGHSASTQHKDTDRVRREDKGVFWETATHSHNPGQSDFLPLKTWNPMSFWTDPTKPGAATSEDRAV